MALSTRALAVALVALAALETCGREPCSVCGCRQQGEDRIVLLASDAGLPPDGGSNAEQNAFCYPACSSAVRCSAITTDAGEPAVLCHAPIICID